MSEYAIKVSNVSLSYYTHKGISIKNLFHKNIGQDKFQALRGIDFELKKGRILGIVGRNGSGKSTLLRAIGGIFSEILIFLGIKFPCSQSESDSIIC